MSSGCFVTVSSDWEALEKQGTSKKDEQNKEPLLRNAKFDSSSDWTSITTIMTLLIVVLGTVLNLVWEIRIKLNEFRIKGMGQSRVLTDMNARVKNSFKRRRFKRWRIRGPVLKYGHAGKHKDKQEAAECVVTVSSDWEALEKQKQEPWPCNDKFGHPHHWISITTNATLLVAVLGAGLNLVWAQNVHLREIERDHEIRMKEIEIKRLRIKGMDYSRALAEMNVGKTKEMAHSRTTADMQTSIVEWKRSNYSRQVVIGEKPRDEEFRAAEHQMRKHALEFTRHVP